MKATAYLHSDKETMYELGEKIGLKGEALDFFKHALCEVVIELEVNPDGSAYIVRVDGHRIPSKIGA